MKKTRAAGGNNLLPVAGRKASFNFEVGLWFIGSVPAAVAIVQLDFPWSRKVCWRRGET